VAREFITCGDDRHTCSPNTSLVLPWAVRLDPRFQLRRWMPGVPSRHPFLLSPFRRFQSRDRHHEASIEGRHCGRPGFGCGCRWPPTLFRRTKYAYGRFRTRRRAGWAPAVTPISTQCSSQSSPSPWGETFGGPPWPSSSMANQLNAQESASHSGGGWAVPAPAMGEPGSPRNQYGQPNQVYGIPGAGQPSAGTPVPGAR
jgi:hypothetical protein